MGSPSKLIKEKPHSQPIPETTFIEDLKKSSQESHWVEDDMSDENEQQITADNPTQIINVENKT